MNSSILQHGPARWLHLVAVGVLALALGGCAAFAPPRPFTTADEALAARGEPTARWPADDGTTVLEFATQPHGTSCLMVEVDATGVVLRQWDALAADNLARARPGMTQDEIRRLLGQYRSVQRFPLSQEEVWDWNVRKEWPDLVATRFNVHFVDGKVKRTSYSHEYPRERWMFGFGIGRGVNPHWGFGWRYPYWDPWWGW